MLNLTNEELQKAIDSLLNFYSLLPRKTKWCENGRPDGALSQCLADLLHEQRKRGVKD